MRYTIMGLLLLAHLCMQPASRKMDLQKAIDLKLVKVLARSTGGYQGFCIRMELKNLTEDSLTVLVEAGRRLNSDDDKNQDILITREETIRLRKQERKEFPLKGYCCQASNRAPPAGAFYHANTLADNKLVLLARYLNVNEAEPDAEQKAVWAISDGRPAAEVLSPKDSLQKLKQLVCILKDEPMPWYSIVSKTVVYESGAMQVYPLWLRGELDYSVSAYCYTTLHILNEEGTEVGHIVEQWTGPGANRKYALNIPVKGLAKGKYVIELKAPGKQLALREFEI